MFTLDQTASAAYRTQELRAQARRDAVAQAVAPRRRTLLGRRTH